SGMEAIKLGAIHPTRDFNFVRDTVRGFIATAECDAALGKVINIGNNYEISIGDTARLIAGVMGREVKIIGDEQRLRPAASEVERLWADNTRACALAGWVPEYGGMEGLRRGLKETIDWFTEPSNLNHYKAGAYNI